MTSNFYTSYQAFPFKPLFLYNILGKLSRQKKQNIDLAYLTLLYPFTQVSIDTFLDSLTGDIYLLDMSEYNNNKKELKMAWVLNAKTTKYLTQLLSYFKKFEKVNIYGLDGFSSDIKTKKGNKKILLFTKNNQIILLFGKDIEHKFFPYYLSSKKDKKISNDFQKYFYLEDKSISMTFYSKFFFFNKKLKEISKHSDFPYIKVILALSNFFKKSYSIFYKKNNSLYFESIIKHK